MKDDFKIRIFQPIVPEYRVALFDGLGECYGERIEIWAAQGSGQDKSYPLSRMRYDYNHPMWKVGPFVWQKRLSLKGLNKRDVIVVCGDVHQLSSLWIALKARLCGVKVVWWGHHRTATSTGVAVWLRLSVARVLSTVFLAYTRTGIDYLVQFGFSSKRVFATGNTIDQEPIKAAVESWTTERLERFQAEHGIKEKKLLLCCSVLRSKVKLDLAIRALSSDALSDVYMAVIGDGAEKTAWQSLAKELRVDNRIKWIDATRDQMVMAPWFLSAKAFVYPGSIGLSILHSFSYGLPVITHGNTRHQMPEFEVMEDEKTGLCFKEGDVGDLEQKICALLADEGKRMDMTGYCRKLAFEKYSMKQMIANFCEAIEAAHESVS